MLIFIYIKIIFKENFFLDHPLGEYKLTQAHGNMVTKIITKILSVKFRIFKITFFIVIDVIAKDSVNSRDKNITRHMFCHLSPCVYWGSLVAVEK